MFHVVKFAVRGGEPKLFLISEEEHDRWCECEPPEGYAAFETLATFEVAVTTLECLRILIRLYLDNTAPGWQSGRCDDDRG